MELTASSSVKFFVVPIAIDNRSTFVLNNGSEIKASSTSSDAGRSEAIYAHCIGMQLGGENRYGERVVQKPVLGASLAPFRPLLVGSQKGFANSQLPGGGFGRQPIG